MPAKLLTAWRIGNEGQRLSSFPGKLPKGKKASPVAFWVIDAALRHGGHPHGTTTYEELRPRGRRIDGRDSLIAFDLQIAFPRG